MKQNQTKAKIKTTEIRLIRHSRYSLNEESILKFTHILKKKCNKSKVRMIMYQLIFFFNLISFSLLFSLFHISFFFIIFP